MVVVQQTAAKRCAAMAPGSNAVDIRENIVFGQQGRQNPIDEIFLGLAFGKDMKPDQREGLPPTTFFSHNSDNV